MKRKWLSVLCVLSLALSMQSWVYATPGNEEEEPPLLPNTQETPASVSPEATPEASGLPEDSTIIVGLAYGSNALPGANLQVDVGIGYRFGYLDADRVFQPLGSTEEIHISVVKDRTVWYGSDNGYMSYSDKITSDIMVGGYHIQYPIEVTTYEEALAAAGAYEDGFPAWIQGAWQVRSGAYETEEKAQAAAAAVGGTVGETSMYGVSVVSRGTSRILFQFDGGKDIPFIVKPGQDDTVKTVTWFKGVRYFGGFQYYRLNGGNLTVSGVLPLNDYAECVISQEMSPSWPVEALKAQAICARSYYELGLRTGNHKSQGFDICSGTHCQAYPGMDKTNSRTAQATEETTGLRVWYQGMPARTYYFSSDGGATEDPRNVWGGKEDFPYLRGVIDPYEADVAKLNYYSSWTKTFTASDLTQLLRDKGYGNAAIVDFRITELTDNGNVKSIAFIDANGKSWPFVHQSGVRDLLELRSMRYSVTASGETTGGSYYTQDGTALTTMSGVYAINGDGRTSRLDGEVWVISASGEEVLSGPYGGSATGKILFTIQGSGWGHHVGMSQWGAYAMATKGYTYEDIIKFYYPGVEIY